MSKVAYLIEEPPSCFGPGALEWCEVKDVCPAMKRHFAAMHEMEKKHGEDYREKEIARLPNPEYERLPDCPLKRVPANALSPVPCGSYYVKEDALAVGKVVRGKPIDIIYDLTEEVGVPGASTSVYIVGLKHAPYTAFQVTSEMIEYRVEKADK